MSKLKSVKVVAVKKEKALTMPQKLEGLKSPIKKWAGVEYQAGSAQKLAAALLNPLIDKMVEANYTVECLRSKTAKTATEKKKAKLLADAIFSGLLPEVQLDIIFVRSFDGKRRGNSWKAAARLRGDSPERIVSMTTNSNKPSAHLGKIEVRLIKALAKKAAVDSGEPSNTVGKKSALSKVAGNMDRVLASLKPNDDFPEDFNDHRRKSLLVEINALKAEIERLSNASNLTA